VFYKGCVDDQTNRLAVEASRLSEHMWRVDGSAVSRPSRVAGLRE
jgi:hypothetical protein